MTETPVIDLSVNINDTNANAIAVIRLIRKVFGTGLKESKDIVDEMFYTASWLTWRGLSDDEKLRMTKPYRWSTRVTHWLLDEATAARWLLENELDGRPFEIHASRRTVVVGVQA